MTALKTFEYNNIFTSLLLKVEKLKSKSKHSSYMQSTIVSFSGIVLIDFSDIALSEHEFSSEYSIESIIYIM